MKFLNYKLLLVLFTALVLFNCEEEQATSPILVFLTPTGTTIEANTNDHVFITVEASTNIGNTLSLHIESVDDLYGIQPLFDSIFNRTSFNYMFDYIVPQFPDSTETLLIFSLANDVNDEAKIAKRILINKGESFVSESTGHIIYSSASDKPNSFSLKSLSPGYLADSATFEVDIVDASDIAIHGETLSRTWISHTGLSFVQFNGFNYASANSLTIKNAYEIGVKLSKITNIQDSDVYLVGKGSAAIGVIQVVAVTDQPMVTDDKYTFSIKKLD